MEEVKPYQNIEEFKKFSPYKFGLFRQCELFKRASMGEGQPNYDLMCDAIQNLKCDLKAKMIINDFEKDLEKVERILIWYKTKEQKYIKNTEDGPQVIFPYSIGLQMNQKLTIAYEILMKSMHHMGLLD